MATINEKAQWESEVHLLARGDRVEGGTSGAANIQAKQLANRTAFLKMLIESAMDFKDYTFTITPEDPDGTKAGISATPQGKSFRVGQGAGRGFKYYMNDNGAAVEFASSPGFNDFNFVATLQDAVSYLEGSEYARSGVDSAILDSNKRIMMYWKGQQAFYISLSAVKGEFESVAIGDTTLTEETAISASQLAEQIEFSKNSEYARSGMEFAVLDKNNRVISRGRNITREDIWYSDDADGRSQIFIIDNESGAIERPEKTDSDETDVQDKGDYVVWKSTRTASIDNKWFNGRVQGGLWFSYKDEYAPHPVIPRCNFALWGHSFIADPRMASRLYEKTALQCFIFGRSNGVSNGIAARQGGRQQMYMPVGGVIPEEKTAVALIPNCPGPLALGGNGAAADSLRHCWLAGVYGTLAWDGKKATFTREAAGELTRVPYVVPLQWEAVCTSHCINTLTDENTWAGTAYPMHAEAINIFWIGRNNYMDEKQVIHDLIGMVDIVERSTLHPRIVIMPEFPAQSEIKGTEANDAILSLNARYKDLFPQYYCEVGGVDALENFRRHYNPSYADDVEDVRNGVTPRSLRYDALHPSQSMRDNGLFTGAEVNADFIIKFLTSKGWLK